MHLLSNLEHKHPASDQQHQPYLTHKSPLAILWLGIFLTVSILPQNAMAFEANLSSAPSQKLVAPVYLKNRDSTLVLLNTQLPTESFTHSSSVAAVPAVETKQGHWPKPAPQRVVLAYAAPAVAPAAAIAPRNGSLVVMEGEASYYSRAGCLGCNPLRIMANGQPLNDGALTMAIGADKKHLVGRTARVTNLNTGLSVDVRITDTGGFYKAKYGNRVADLTIATKEAIGMRGGVGQVRVEVY